jgi:hypothetical protein
VCTPSSKVALPDPCWHSSRVELHGTITENLESAVRSAERLRRHQVHQDTQAYWRSLIAHARATMRHSPQEDTARPEQLIARLEAELANLKPS